MNKFAIGTVIASALIGAIKENVGSKNEDMIEYGEFSGHGFFPDVDTKYHDPGSDSNLSITWYVWNFDTGLDIKTVRSELKDIIKDGNASKVNKIKIQLSSRCKFPEIHQFSNLEELIIVSKYDYTSSSIDWKRIANGCPKLKKVAIIQEESFSVFTIKKIPQLEYLAVLSEEHVVIPSGMADKFPSLKSFMAKGRSHIVFNSENLFENMLNLKDLTLHCGNSSKMITVLTDKIKCPNLNRLSITSIQGIYVGANPEYKNSLTEIKVHSMRTVQSFNHLKLFPNLQVVKYKSYKDGASDIEINKGDFDKVEQMSLFFMEATIKFAEKCLPKIKQLDIRASNIFGLENLQSLENLIAFFNYRMFDNSRQYALNAFKIKKLKRLTLIFRHGIPWNRGEMRDGVDPNYDVDCTKLESLTIKSLGTNGRFILSENISKCKSLESIQVSPFMNDKYITLEIPESIVKCRSLKTLTAECGIVEEGNSVATALDLEQKGVQIKIEEEKRLNIETASLPTKTVKSLIKNLGIYRIVGAYNSIRGDWDMKSKDATVAILDSGSSHISFGRSFVTNWGGGNIRQIRTSKNYYRQFENATHLALCKPSKVLQSLTIDSKHFKYIESISSNHWNGSTAEANPYDVSVTLDGPLLTKRQILSHLSKVKSQLDFLLDKCDQEYKDHGIQLTVDNHFSVKLSNDTYRRMYEIPSDVIFPQIKLLKLRLQLIQIDDSIKQRINDSMVPVLSLYRCVAFTQFNFPHIESLSIRKLKNESFTISSYQMPKLSRLMIDSVSVNVILGRLPGQSPFEKVRIVEAKSLLIDDSYAMISNHADFDIMIFARNSNANLSVSPAVLIRLLKNDLINPDQFKILIRRSGKSNIGNIRRY